MNLKQDLFVFILLFAWRLLLFVACAAIFWAFLAFSIDVNRFKIHNITTYFCYFEYKLFLLQNKLSFNSVCLLSIFWSFKCTFSVLWNIYNNIIRLSLSFGAKTYWVSVLVKFSENKRLMVHAAKTTVTQIKAYSHEPFPHKPILFIKLRYSITRSSR